MSAAWHVYDGREREGPLSADEVERRYAAGALGTDALVWREGWSDWRPVASALSRLRSEPEAAAASPGSEAPGLRARAGPPLLAAVVSLAIVALAVVAATRLLDAIHDIVDTAEPSTVVQSYLTLVWGLAAGLAVAIASLWWLSTRLRRWRLASMAPGLMRGLIALAAILGGAFLALQLRLTPLVHEIAVSVASQVAAVRYAPAGGWVSIDGEIGPRLADQVARQLQAHPDARGILIDSPGGMTSEALRLAQLIERRGLEVRVERDCFSACMGVLVSGRRRTAEWNARIALHALAPAVNRYPAFLKLVLNQGRREFEGYMARHRMPKAWIAEAEAAGPEHLRPTPPPDLLAAGVLTAVTRDGVPLDATDAKWLWVEAVAGAGTGLADLLEAIRTNAPEVVRASGDELYSSVASGDPRRAAGAVSSIVAPVIRRAQLSAEAEPTYLFVEASLDQIAFFSQRGDWTACAAYLDGRMGAVDPPALQLKEREALAGLIRSAGQAHWRAAETGELGLAAAREAETGASGRLTALGIGGQADDRARCLRSFFVLQAVDQLGPERGAAAWRTLLQGGR